MKALISRGITERFGGVSSGEFSRFNPSVQGGSFSLRAIAHFLPRPELIPWGEITKD